MGKKFPRKNKISLPTGMRPAGIASTIMALSVNGLEDKEMKKKKKEKKKKTKRRT